jgi:hypothetical protein
MLVKLLSIVERKKDFITNHILAKNVAKLLPHTFMKEISFLVGATNERYCEGFESLTLTRINPSVVCSKSTKQMKHVGAHKCNFLFWFIYSLTCNSFQIRSSRHYHIHL